MDGEDAMEESYIMKGQSNGEREREREKNALKEKGEQYYILGESCFLRSLCVKLDTHLYLNTNLILQYNCPWAELIVIVLSHLLQILLAQGQV